MVSRVARFVPYVVLTRLRWARLAWIVVQRVARLIKAGQLPVTSRAVLLVLLVRTCTGPEVRRDVAVPACGGPLFLGSSTVRVDILTLLEIWGDKIFPADCRGRVVLDIGAHKGYFGAWALAQGAAGVLSCEPQSQNFRLLDRTRRANEGTLRWITDAVAVGHQEGTGILYVSRDSWAHSLYAHMSSSVATEKVVMTTLPNLLARAQQKWPSHEVVAKVNVEGAAADVLLAAAPHEFRDVVEVLLDHEAGSPVQLTSVLDHLRKAGLDDVDRLVGNVHRVRRSATRQSADA